MSHVIGLNLRYYRVDAVSGNFFGYYDSGGGCLYYPNEVLIDSLAANINNISAICPSMSKRACTNIEPFQSCWGSSYNRKRFQFYNGNTQTPSAYFMGIGLSGSADGPLGEVSFDLIGCVINNIVYGDTTLTVIHNLSNQIPNRFSLSQNYPNPFNPKTIIKYSIPTTQFTILKVYNALGKEVSTLVDKKQNAGTYEVDFNGEGLPSGIYFYQLNTEDFLETRRMILLK
ncbi:MAG: T9SS type A sorting domain-containing protein [Ignavibacteria bacterium]